LNPDGAIEIFH